MKPVAPSVSRAQTVRDLTTPRNSSKRDVWSGSTSPTLVGRSADAKWKIKVKTTAGEKTTDFTIDRAIPLSEQISKLVGTLEKTGADPTYYAIQRIINQKYIIQEDLEDANYHVAEGETCMLVDQSLEAESVVATINMLCKQADQKKPAEMLKKHVFHLGDHMRVDVFGEEFIVQGGMESLLTVINVGGSTSAAYALKALSSTLLYLNGLEYIKSSPGVLEKLFVLTYSSSTGVVRHSLALTFVIAQFVDEGYSLVHRCIKKICRARDQKPYQNVVDLLLSGDLDVKVNALTLINVLLKKTPNKRKLKKLLARLEEVSLFANLEKQEEISDPDFITQLEVLREISGANIAPTRIEVSVLRSKLNERTLELEKAERTLHDYRRHQALVETLRSELMRYRKAVVEAYELGVLINAYAPQTRFQKGSTAPKTSDILALATPTAALASAFTVTEKNKKDYNSILVDLNDLAKEEKGRAELQSAGENALKVTSLSEQNASLEKDLKAANQKIKHLSDEVKKLKEQRFSISLGGGDEAPPGPPPSEDELSAATESGSSSSSDEVKKLKRYAKHLKKENLELKKQIAELKGVPYEPTTESTSGGSSDAPPMDDDVAAPPMDEDAPAPPPMGDSPGISQIQPTKPVIKPKRPMKKLHWKRYIFPAKPSSKEVDTIWRDLADIDIDEKEFEEEFCQKTFEKKHRSETEVSTPGESSSGGGELQRWQKKQKKRCLTDKRSNNIAIMMTNLPIIPQLRSAIITLDASVLPEAKLEKLRRELPTEEEIRNVKQAAEEDVDNLDRPEQLILMLSGLSRLQERLQCWSYSLSFHQHAVELKENLEGYYTACKDLRSNKSLRLAINLVLALGNYMNGGTPKGQADGFEIDFLTRIVDTKNVTNSTSLLEYVARVLKDMDSSSINLKADLSALFTAATKAPLEELLNEARRLENNYNLTKKMAEVVSKDPLDTGDQFTKKMESFLASAEHTVRQIAELADRTSKLYQKTWSYFGEGNPEDKPRPSGEFLDVFVQFVEELVKAFPKDKKTITTMTRKHKIGEKLHDKKNKGGDMLSIINSIKSGGVSRTEKKEELPSLSGGGDLTGGLSLGGPPPPSPSTSTHSISSPPPHYPSTSSSGPPSHYPSMSVDDLPPPPSSPSVSVSSLHVRPSTAPPPPSSPPPTRPGGISTASVRSTTSTNSPASPGFKRPMITKK